MPANPTPAEGVVVPLEPMPEMLAAFWRQKNTGSQVPGETGDDRSDYAAYRAMLAARPVATTQSAAQTGEEEDWRLVRQLVEMMDEWSSSLALRTNDGACTGFPDHEAALRRIAALSQREPGQ